MGEWREVSLTSGGFPGCSNHQLIPGATTMVARIMTRARVFTTAAMSITASMVVTTPADLNDESGKTSRTQAPQTGYGGFSQVFSTELVSYVRPGQPSLTSKCTWGLGPAPRQPMSMVG